MRVHALTLATLACLAAACVGNHAYRPEAPGTGAPERQYFVYEQLENRQFEPEATTVNDTYPYRLGFVEFDDRGEMFIRAQLRRVVEEIGKAKAEARSRGTVAVVAVFVHGWKNNASPQSGNVWGFRQVLAGLSKRFGKRPVVGVYIGWRGAVLSPPVVREFTFFDRQQKSQNIAGGHMVEALLKIAQAARGVEYDESPATSARTVMIGHSFGGAVLETALTQTIVGLAARAAAPPALLEQAGEPSPSRMRWPADLTIFVNEAQEATRSYQLLEALHQNLPERDQWLPAQQRPNGCASAASAQQAGRLQDGPAIVSISSTGDSATRIAYKAVQGLQRPFHSLRSYEGYDPNVLGLKRQTPLFLNTTAHMTQFQSHVMGRCECAGLSCTNCEDAAVAAATEACGPALTARLGASPLPYVIAEKPHTRNRTPYWVLQMPPSVVADHSTIFTPTFRDLVVRLFCRALSTKEPEPLCSEL